MSHRWLTTGSLVFAFFLGAVVSADEVLKYDGSTINGRLQKVRSETLSLETGDEAGEPVSVPMQNVRQLRVDPAETDVPGPEPVIDNSSGDGEHSASGSIKLLAGFHRFSIVYWQGDGDTRLRFDWEWPGRQRQTVPKGKMHHIITEGQLITVSPGVDDDGFRQPDDIESQAAIIDYAIYAFPDWQPASFAGLRNATSVNKGTRNLPLLQANNSGPFLKKTPGSNFGVVFSGFLHVPQDEEYTFHLTSTGGCRLYFGDSPEVVKLMSDSSADSWKVTFADEGQLIGQIDDWDETRLTIDLALGEDPVKARIPTDGYKEMWRTPLKVDRKLIKRKKPSARRDTLYARNDEGEVHSSTGVVQGLTDGELRIEENGETRTIPVEQVIGVVARLGEDDDEPEPAPQTIEYVGGMTLPGTLRRADDRTITFRTPWRQLLKTRRLSVGRVLFADSRVQQLAELEPAKVIHTPFFKDALSGEAWKQNESLSGDSLQIGTKVYDHGIVMQSRTSLTYEVDGTFNRFQCQLGIQRGFRLVGNAHVRVRAGDAVIFEAAEVKAGDLPQDVQLDITGCTRLTLEVDYGAGFHVGDEVVWGNVELLREMPAESAPVSPPSG